MIYMREIATYACYTYRGFLLGQCMFLSVTVPDDIFKYLVDNAFRLLQTLKLKSLKASNLISRYFDYWSNDFSNTLGKSW